MANSTTCELEQYKVAAAQFIHIDPRPRADAPPDLEQTLQQMVKDTLESESHSCPDGCECVIGEPVEVATHQLIKKVTDGTYTGWYKVTLAKYRTAGECMPAGDELPEGVKG